MSISKTQINAAIAAAATGMKIGLIFLCCIVFLQVGQAQTAFPQPAKKNTLSKKRASTASSSGVEGPVKYWADNISFDLPKQTTHLEGKVKIEYQTITLTAGKVDIDWTRSYMTAVGIADSTDSLGNAVYRELPVLTEKGSDPIRGVRLEYDFKNNRGKVKEGRTKMPPGYYLGEEIRKIGQETLLIEDAYFTTCDREEHPHFYFKSQKMRVQMNKKAVAKPVTLYIEDVPLLTFPFAVFSLRKGRRSGIILPTYGQNSFGGRYLQDFGYYWAASDYWDATMLATFYERTGFVFSGKVDYKKRYGFNGQISGNYAPKDIRTGAKRQRWEISFNHNQKIGQTTTITGNGRFISDRSFLQEYYSDFNQRTNQTLLTNASIKKNFPGSRVLSLNFRRSENLQTDRIDYTFPDLSYSQPAKSLFKYRGGGKGPRWYHNIRYTYSSSLKSSGFSAPKLDSLGQKIGTQHDLNAGWRHQINPSFSTKMFKYFNVTPRMSFQELWVPEYLDYSYDDSTQQVKIDTIDSFRSRHLLTGMGMNVRTTMYGLWEIPLLPVKVIRHKMDPSIGFSYAPDYTDPSFGYFQEIRDGDGNFIARRDRFAKSIFGGTPGGGEQRNLNINVNNLFQGKIIRDGEEKKIDLFRVNFGTSYNFARDSLRLSNLTTSAQAKPLKSLNITFNSTHSFYQKAPNGVGRINKFVWADGFKLPELLSWNTRVTYNLSLRPPQRKAETAVVDTSLQNPLTGEAYESPNNIPGDQIFGDYQPLKMPWSLNMNFSFSYSDNQGNISRRFDTGMNARVQLTKNWNVTYSNRLNITDKKIVDQRFNISRDLHCWQMNFQWSPNPNFSFFRLEIRVKESILQDLKLTKTSNQRPFLR